MEIREEQVEKRLSELNISKSPGPDNLHPRVLKELASVLAKPLSIVYRTSLDSGIVPMAWKTARITQIFKKGDKRDPSNYRPVSLTSIASKILESIIGDSVMSHLLTNNLLSSKQFGFIAGRSTTLQILKMMDEWTDTE